MKCLKNHFTQTKNIHPYKSRFTSCAMDGGICGWYPFFIRLFKTEILFHYEPGKKEQKDIKTFLIENMKEKEKYDILL